MQLHVHSHVTDACIQAIHSAIRVELNAVNLTIEPMIDCAARQIHGALLF